MHNLYNLKEMLCKELEEFGKRGDLQESSLKTVDTLAHACKNVCKIIECCEEDEYSNYSRRSYRMGGSYDGGSYDGEGSYDTDPQSFVRPDGSYRDSSYRGRGRNAARDSMGRYSRSGDMKSELRRLMEQAPDEHTRMEFEEFIKKMDRM